MTVRFGSGLGFRVGWGTTLGLGRYCASGLGFGFVLDEVLDLDLDVDSVLHFGRGFGF